MQTGGKSTTMNVIKEKSKTIYIKDEYGLHARPAAQLAKEAANYESRIYLMQDKVQVDAKSVLDILSLAATPGKSLTVRAVGPDSEEAVKMVENFLVNIHGEY